MKKMKLFDFVRDIESTDDVAIIFLEDREDYSSDILLSYAEEQDNGIKEENGRKFYYLIEVFLAKEFIEDWLAILTYKPTLEETARRLYDYANNDA
jgi:hypothetical protein